MTSEEAIKILNKIILTADFTDEYGDMINTEPYEEAIELAIEALENEPKKSEWIGDTDYESCQGMYERYKCSECGYGIDWRKHNQLMCQDEIPEEYREYYCPHCGAKIMEEGE